MKDNKKQPSMKKQENNDNSNDNNKHINVKCQTRNNFLQVIWVLILILMMKI